MKNIVIATDGSVPSQEAVEFGVELAAEQGADVVFVHAVPPDEFYVGSKIPLPAIPHSEAIEESETALRAAAAAAKDAGVSYKLERISDVTVHAILEVAEAQNAELIVVGSRGRGSIGAGLLGSVSRELVKRSKRPVLVVKGVRVPVST